VRNRLREKARRTIKKHRLRYCFGGDYMGRIILPVYRKNQLVFFQGRSFYPPNRKPKYKNIKDAEVPVFGLQDCKPGEPIILCEGYFDVIALGPGAVTGFGAKLTNVQLREIHALRPKLVTVCFDPDEAGERGYNEVCLALLGAGLNVHVALDLDGDPAELGASARSQVESRAVPFSRFFDLTQNRV